MPSGSGPLPPDPYHQQEPAYAPAVPTPHVSYHQQEPPAAAPRVQLPPPGLVIPPTPASLLPKPVHAPPRISQLAPLPRRPDDIQAGGRGDDMRDIEQRRIVREPVKGVQGKILGSRTFLDSLNVKYQYLN